MVDPTAITEAPIVAEPLTETQSLEEINVDTPTVETPSTAPTVEMPTALTEGATPDDQPMSQETHKPKTVLATGYENL
ncbi:hypothetical protein E4U32_006318 [Claviceps aff. humidiphila group G2b]|nr:hypothetical protein E4U32_006318 [Claviceps aff. humidiphila group G2b]